MPGVSAPGWTRPGARHRDRSVAGIAAVVFAVLACLTAWGWDASGRQVTDVGLYRAYGERMAGGEVPYRDFDVEYPPGALPVFLLPALVSSDRTGYTLALSALLAVVGAVGVVVVGRSLAALGRSPATVRHVLGLLALSPLLLGALLLTRFDLVPATLLAAALLALLRERPRPAGLLLGAAVAVKLYPVVVLPVAVAWVARRHGRREAQWLAALTIGLPALAYAVFVILAPGGVGWSLGHQLSRPLQIESLGASALLVSHAVGGLDLGWSSGHGSQNLDGAAAAAVALVAPALQIAALAACWWAAVRVRGGDDLVRLAAAAVAAFVAFGKVLSPQYLVWLLFLVPLVAGVRGRRAAVLYGGAAALTLGWFPHRYWQLVKEFDPLATWLLAGRNLALVGLVVVLLLPLSRRVGPGSG